VLTGASWSVIFGCQTPLQSGSLARSAQSCAVGAGLITDGVFFGACADVCDATEAAIIKIKKDLRMVGEQIFMGYSPARYDPTSRQSSADSMHCEADPAAKRDHRYPHKQRYCGGGLGWPRRLPGDTPSRDITNADEMKDRHVEACQH